MTVTDQEPQVISAPEPTGLQDAFREYVSRVRGGDVGPLPAILGLAFLVVIFSLLRPETFTNPFNFANLLIQSAPVIVIAMGLIFVLLIGEIDLSAGFTAGVAGAVLGVVSTRNDYPWYLGVLACLVTGAVHRPGHRVAGGPRRHPVLRRHAGRLPRPAGPAAADHRRGRHDPDPERDRAGDHVEEPAGLARLDDVRRRSSPPTRW